jgi:2-polyprenyl-3-methyl-5-hydroxy-6-metoxy-1,4-benzoquinol methylase
MSTSKGSGTWTPPMRFLLRKNLIHKLLREENVNGKSCLEMGYGAGELLFLYKKLGLDVYGYDFSDSAYAYSSERVAKDTTPGTIHLLQSEEEVNRQHYDYIMAFEVLEHIEDDVTALKQWRDQLNNGGKVILSFPAHQSKWMENDVLAGHFRRYEQETIKALFEAADMKLNKVWCYGYPLTLALDPLLKGFAKKKLASMEGMSMEELTKVSSLHSKSSLAKRLLSNDIALFPFYWLQRPLINTDFGSGYIVMGEK